MEKSFAFSVRAVRAYQHLASEKKEYVLSKQFLRSATSIGANVHEANNAQSKKDFISKMYISYKEATETEYWIKLLTETEYFTDAEGSSLLSRLCGIEADFNRHFKKCKAVGIIYSAFCILHSALSGGG